jgi:Flp pilus assembly protein TadD
VQGSLSQEFLPDIICSLNESRETGILSLSRAKVNKRIYFGEGTMIFANSNFRADRLGEFLVRNGKLTKSHLALASKKVKVTGHRLGETFVDMGLMTESEMEVRVAEQILAIIYSVFPWDNGEYRFKDHASPIAEDIALKLPTIPVILEGVRHIKEPEAIRRALGNPKSVVSYARDFSVLPSDCTLTPEESFVLSRVDGQSSIADIISISPLAEEETLRCLYALVSGGFLGLGGKSRDLTPSARRMNLFNPLGQPSKPAKKKTEPETLKLSPEEQWIRDDIVAKRAAVVSGTYYDCLEVRRSADADAIRKAYLTMVKRYHPDRLRSTRLSYLRGDLEEILSKVTEAYKTLSNPVVRRRFDNSLRTEAPRGEDLSPREFLSSKPDKHSPTSVEHIAARYHREAKRHFAKGQFHETIELMEEAVRFDPTKAMYHKLLARALAKNPKWRRMAEEHFQAALDASPFDVECLVGLGELYDTAGMTSRAKTMFAQALELDPANEELRRKVRVH